MAKQIPGNRLFIKTSKSNSGSETKISTGVTTYSSGITAPTINVEFFNQIMSSDASIVTIVAHGTNNKTSTYKVINKTFDGVDGNPTFIISGIVDNIQRDFIYYLVNNNTVSLKNNPILYRHYYTMRTDNAYTYETIAFTIDVPTSTPLTTNEFRAWFSASPFWDANPDNYIGKPLYPVTGLASIVSSVTYPNVGICYYIEQDGMVITATLKLYCSYGATYNLDESNLHCSGIYNLANGERVL